MENKKIISDLSFTSLILIIVTYSSLTLTLFSNPIFFLYNPHRYDNTTQFTKSIRSRLFFPFLLSPFSLLLHLFVLCSTRVSSRSREKPFKIAELHSFHGFNSSQELRRSGSTIPGL
ncbi:hypothetical protein ACOSP7_000547 [Xanthoceras sorbifolium]